ncbi:MAG: sel1 repeat family protein, partial [Bacteroidetes bacterium]|nr:sel1 repeat family protein [Bacteroidota bacterium]
MPTIKMYIRSTIYLFILLILISLPPGITTKASTPANQGDEFLIVDCLLPGQLRKLGRKAVYQTARRHIKTSARNCEIRGGEYVAYDASSYASALKVWLPQAQGGNPEAQTYVGEIYEKGLGLTPDYVTAAQWYQKAADKGYSTAQI